MKIEHEAVSVNTASSPVKSFADNASAVVEPAPDEDFRAHVTQLVREGIAAAKAGDLPAAREILLNAIDLDNRHETALMWLASISDKPLQLLSYLQRVLVLNPKNERAAQWAAATKSLLAKSLIQQGAASHKEGMPEMAAKCFLQATEFEPTNEMAWLWLVSVAVEPEDKLSYLNRVLSLNPTHEKALALFHRTKTQIARSLLKRGNAAAVFGDRETAREILRDVMEYNSNLEEAWLLKAFLSDSNSEKAFCFEKALEINPDSTQARSGLELLQTYPEEDTQATSEEEPSAVAAEEMSVQELSATDLNGADTSAERLTQVFEGETESAEAFVEDDTVATNFVADHYVAVQSVDEESVEEELAQEQIVATADITANLPSDFSNTLPPVTIALEPDQQQPSQLPDDEQEIEEEAMLVEGIVAESEIESEDKAETLSQAIPEVAPEVIPETMVECQFCYTETRESVSRCQGCGAFIRLEEFDQLVTNELNDEARMRVFIEKWQTESAGRELTADEYFNLGLGYLNLRNVKKAVGNFEQVLGLTANTRKWNSEIVALLAYVNEKMPEVLGNNALSTGKTIMVVDDSPTVRKLIVGKLEKHGHRVIAAVDGIDALSKLYETIPDLILLDVTMPRLDGYQLCKQIKANAKTKHVPVVMISGKDGFFDKVRGRMAGSTAYITKPFGPETLLQTVDNYCS
ncbi:MAG: response regulator [Pyrinomonadaceae bacterium]